MSVLRTLATHSRDPEALVAEMRKLDCFMSHFDVEISPLVWRQAKVKEFIEFVCHTIGEEIPSEARPVFLLADLEKLFASYEAGQTEMEDLCQICKSWTENEDDDVRVAIEFFAEKLDPVAEFLSDVKGWPFKPTPSEKSG